MAVQAQDYPASAWAMAQRLAPDAREAGLAAAFDDGDYVRTHVLRPTWHVVAARDVRWLQALTGGRVKAAMRGLLASLDVDSALLARTHDMITRALEGGRSLTRDELGRTLAAAGITASGPRLAAMAMVAELDALICSGPRRGHQHTYALVDERVPASAMRTRDEALAELARRYVTGHGPAQAVDLAWWSGLTVADARTGLQAADPPLSREDHDGRLFWAAEEPGPMTASPVQPIHLLPNYDELLVAFRDRSDGAHPDLPPEARTGMAMLGNVVVREGQVIGRWQRSVGTGRSIRIEVTPFIELDDATWKAIRMATARMARFLGREVVIATPS